MIWALGHSRESHGSLWVGHDRDSHGSLWGWALQAVSGGSLSGHGADEERAGVIADFKI